MRPDLFHALQAKRASRRRSIDQWFRRLGLFLTLTTLGILGILLLNLGADRLELSQLISFPARWGGGGLVSVGGNSSPNDGDSGGGDTVWAGGGNLP